MVVIVILVVVEVFKVVAGVFVVQVVLKVVAESISIS
jgi:hypothetical protein